MRVVTADGTIELGAVETAPTIGITDYSRRVTDDFGVTTVVPRAYARRMSVMIAVPFDQVDDVQRQLADLRATEATWIADDRFSSLSVRGFYKDFEVALDSALSLIPLTIEGTVETGSFVDPGGDPAVEGRSSLQLLDPVAVEGGVLVSSSVAETDAPAWAVAASYTQGARVVVAHRVYESLVAGNVGNDPAGPSGKWLDVGPTGRVAMFDQALGTSTIAAAPIELVLAPGAATSALAVLDTNAATVRVQAPGYDRTQSPNAAGKALFLDLAVAAGAQVTITITPAGAAAPRRWDDGAAWMDAGVWRDSLAAGDGTVTVGTLLIGQPKGLGVTEASPTAGITDYSRKVVDDFGEVTVVPRAWAKRMAAKALIRSDAVDLVAGRLAAVRARPCLWLGQEGVDSLTVYGFFKDFEITVGETVSKLSLSIEGLSQAGKVQPFAPGAGSVAWPDITDPTGTKPTDNADKTSENTSKDTKAVGGTPAGEITGRLKTLVEVTIPAVEAAGAAAGQRITEAQAAADFALSTIESEVERVDQRVDNLSASGGYDDTAVKAEVRRVDEVSLGRDAALGTRIDTVSASITTTDGELRALVQTKETAAVDRENSISQRVDQLIAEGGGGSDGVDTVARAEIQRVERAAVLGQQALASRTDTLETQASPSGGNLVPNSALSTLDGWALTNSPDGLTTLILNASGPAVMIGGAENALTLVRSPAGSGLCSEVQSLPFAVRVGSSVQAYALTVATRCRAWVSIYFLDGTGRFVGYGGEHFSDRISAGGQDLAAWDITGVKEAIVPQGAVRAVIVLRAYDVDGNGIAYFSRPFVTEVKAGTRTWAPYSAGNDRAVTSAARARIATTESTLADLPNRYAAASRTAALEAQVNFAADSGLQRTINSRIEDRATVIADGKLGAANQRMDVMVSEYNGIGARVEQQAGTIAGLDGKAAAYVRIIADAGNGRASLSLWSDQYGGAWSLGGNGLIDGNLTITGSLTARTMDYGSVGEMSIYYDTTSLSFNSQSSWTDIATLALTSRQGQPIEGFFTCILTNLGGTSTQVQARVVRLEDGTPIWGGSGGILIAARDEGESMTASFFDSLGAGTTGTYAVQMKKRAGASNTVSAAYRSMRLVEMSRNKFQQIVINTPAGEGPGRGTYGGGSINGGGYGLGNFNLQ